jgi:hypothetical protein
MSLIALTEIAAEILKNVKFPEWSIFMFGLGRSVTSLCSRDWRQVVAVTKPVFDIPAKVSKNPLIPLGMYWKVKYS